MRCPYCQTLNNERAVYCLRCGRDMRLPPIQQQPPYQQPGQPPRQTPPPYQQPRQAPPTAPHPAPTMPQQTARVRPSAVPPVPEPPAPFPPHTIAQLQALEEAALNYTVVSSTIGDGRKKFVSIAYAKCVPWQQVATLFKAYKEQQEERFDTIIIQGVLEHDPSSYSFTNGQLCFSQNVRLGSLTTNRYQIETGNGYDNDSLRIMLTEA